MNVSSTCLFSRVYWEYFHNAGKARGLSGYQSSLYFRVLIMMNGKGHVSLLLLNICIDI